MGLHPDISRRVIEDPGERGEIVLPGPEEIDWLSATGDEIEAHWIERMKNAPEATYYLLDMDDTLTETLVRWVNFIVRAVYGSENFSEQYARIMNSTNPFAVLRNELGPEFTRLEQKLRFSRWGNSYGKPVDPELPEHLAQILERQGEVLGVLTARPDDPKVMQHTAEWLQKQQLLHELPLYHAPTAFNYAQMQKWKVDVLGRLRRAVDDQVIILIDDSMSTAASVEKWNEKHSDYMPLMQILLSTSLTDKQISETYDPLKKGESSGVFVANNWAHIPEVAEEAKTWYRRVQDSRKLHRRRNAPVR